MNHELYSINVNATLNYNNKSDRIEITLKSIDTQEIIAKSHPKDSADTKIFIGEEMFKHLLDSKGEIQ